MNETAETLKAVRLFGIWKVLYWRFIYARHMRWLHRRGRHSYTHLQHIQPLGNGEQFWCQWCGDRRVVRL